MGINDLAAQKGTDNAMMRNCESIWPVQGKQGHPQCSPTG